MVGCLAKSKEVEGQAPAMPLFLHNDFNLLILILLNIRVSFK